MRKYLALFVGIILSCTTVNAQYVDIPDLAFKNFLKGKYPTCFNAQAQLDTTCTQIIQEDTLIEVQGGNVEGIQYFKSLRYLDFYQAVNKLPSRLPNSLKYLNCGETRVTALPALPDSLEYLICTTAFSSSGLSNMPELPVTLKFLDCSNNKLLRKLPVLPPSLEYLNCSGDALDSLPLLPNSLIRLNCSNQETGFVNSTSLPPLPAVLKYLNCGSNYISKLPVLPNSLDTLICESIQLTSYPDLPASIKYLDIKNADYPFLGTPVWNLTKLPDSLQYFDCTQLRFSSLPALPATLKTLICPNNYLNSLPQLPDSLILLDCSSNGTTSSPMVALPILPKNLKWLSCQNNKLTSLPALPSNLKLLLCGYNQLTSLPALPLTLDSLICNDNLLSSLPPIAGKLSVLTCYHNNIYCLPVIAVSTPLKITLDGDKIHCIPNTVRSALYIYEALDFYPNENYIYLKLCNPVNNENHCKGLPLITGSVFYDNNKNGIKDANEPYRANEKLQLSNGGSAFTNGSGYFELTSDSIGTYTLLPVTLPYFDITPSSVTYTFSTYDTLVINDFALQSNTNIDSLYISISPGWRSTPGFPFAYTINYENAGTTTLSPTIVFNYDNTRLVYDSSSNLAVINNGSSLSLNTGSLVSGQQGNFVAYFRVKTNTMLGDTIFTKASIDATSANAADSNTVVIRGSFDPNDKQATPQLTPLQVAAGKYINYTIRFQNTGTDTAFNIVISDTLSNQLQWNTLEMLNTSHPCKTTVNGDKVYFEFLNILLPDSNVNEPASHGFVSFRIKTKPTVPVNSTIPNKASIYFDYNAPVVTNTAGTLVKDFSTIPLRLLSFSAVPQSNNTTALYWNTANEINTSRFVIEQSVDGIHFVSINSVFAKGLQSNSYSITVSDAVGPVIYYRIKMIDMAGNFIYTPVLKINRKKANGFSVLTNPVKDFIIINTTDRSLNNTSCSIISTQGVVVKTFTVKQGTQTVYLKDLPAGVYYLRTEDGSSKILIQ